MELFEIHITGKGPKILEALAQMKLKGITINLLSPEDKVIGTEYMSSIQWRYPNYEHCKLWVDDLVYDLKAMGIEIERVKIECPVYDHYLDKAIYIESHFPAVHRGSDSSSNIYPISVNAGSGKAIATDREYRRDFFKQFQRDTELMNAKVEVELCLFDTNVKQDDYWFDMYI